MLNKTEKELIEEMIIWFTDRPMASYMDFCIGKCSNKDLMIFRKRIDSIRKKLQRKGVMSCVKINDSSGRFYSKKNINYEVLFQEYGIKIE